MAVQVVQLCPFAPLSLKKKSGASAPYSDDAMRGATWKTCGVAHVLSLVLKSLTILLSFKETKVAWIARPATLELALLGCFVLTREAA